MVIAARVIDEADVSERMATNASPDFGGVTLPTFVPPAQALHSIGGSSFSGGRTGGPTCSQPVPSNRCA
jgi:hypothetical protein